MLNLISTTFSQINWRPSASTFLERSNNWEEKSIQRTASDQKNEGLSKNRRSRRKKEKAGGSRLRKFKVYLFPYFWLDSSEVDQPVDQVLVLQDRNENNTWESVVHKFRERVRERASAWERERERRMRKWEANLFTQTLALVLLVEATVI